MPEHLAPVLYYLEIHLLYASCAWVAAWVLTSFGQGSATAKYWIWVATSINFIVPAGAVVDWLWSSHLAWATPLGAIGAVGADIAEDRSLATVLFLVWLVGAGLMFTRLCLRIRGERRDARAISPQSAGAKLDSVVYGVPVRFVGARRAPAVRGVLRPHISLPDGIDQLLSEPELSAVLIHEVTHARRRDNLLRLFHEVGLCVLWFHPLVWITGSRLALYRELSCDESVIERARGRDLVSALAKLANPEESFLLQATASSFINHRLARLTAQPPRIRLAANFLLIVAFGGALVAGVFGTVAHTACCFLAKSLPRRTSAAAVLKQPDTNSQLQPVACSRTATATRAEK